MSAEETITILKEQYTRDIRKQLVKSMLEEERQKSPKAHTTHIINQIFSYVLKNSNWNITLSSSDWDDAPLNIMKEVFPKIETTTWYQDKKLEIDKNIDVVVGN